MTPEEMAERLQRLDRDGDPYDNPSYIPGHHVCGAGSEPRPGRAEYRQCRCGQWYRWSGARWLRVRCPPRRWLRRHGMDAGSFPWNASGDAPARRRSALAAVRAWLQARRQ